MSKIIAGLDIGNGYVKGMASEQTTGFVADIDLPSDVAYIMATHDMKTGLDEAGDVINDIYNQMDVSFDSPLIKDKNRMLFGDRGIKSGNAVEEFDVCSPISKAQQHLSYILTLGCLAGMALQDYWNSHKSLPTETIKVDARVALALPIAEFKKYRTEYANNYKSGKHTVTFHNFEQPIQVEISFEDVQVIAEGASAQYAIRSKGEGFVNAMLAEIRRMGEPLEGIAAKDIMSATNTIGIDIGEGTVNFPVFQSAVGKANGKFNPDVPLTFDKGYGAVLDDARDRLQDAGYPFKSRKELQAFLNTVPNAMTRSRHEAVKKIVDEEISSFVMQVGMQFSKIMSRVGTFTEVIYVYGGGASPVKDELYPLVIDKAKSFSGGEQVACPILYLDSRYSRYLNREGLYEMARKVAEQA